MLTELAWDDECRLARFHEIRNFITNEIFSFQGCSTKQAAFLPGQLGFGKIEARV